MKYFVIAGERSGDLHASGLIREIKKKDKNAEIAGWGGNYMKEAGADIRSSYQGISHMGFLEIAHKITIFRERLKRCKCDIDAFKPDLVILIDFAGFNLRIAAFAKSRNIKTCYYIAPKIWAWNKGRIKRIKTVVDLMLVTLPFEKHFYEQLDYSVQYVGNPVAEVISAYRWNQSLISKLRLKTKNIAFLPGSRLQEVVYAMEIIEKLAEVYDEYQFLVAGVDNLDAAIYEPIRRLKNVSLFFNKTYELLKASEAAIVTSGTATLETALLGVPQVVVYKASTISYAIARLLVTVKYISLVNLIANKAVVKELIQSDYNPVDIAAGLESLLYDEQTKKRISEGYSEIQVLIGKQKASQNAAEAIDEFMRLLAY